MELAISRVVMIFVPPESNTTTGHILDDPAACVPDNGTNRATPSTKIVILVTGTLQNSGPGFVSMMGENRRFATENGDGKGGWAPIPKYEAILG